MPSFFDKGLCEESDKYICHTFTQGELEICRSLGAKWITKEEGFTHTVMLWDKKPRCEMYNGEKSYEGAVATANVAPEKFPSLIPGDCVCVENMRRKES